MIRRFLTQILLAGALLGAQHAALAHQVSHLAGNADAQNQGLVHTKLCDKCASFAKISAAVPALAAFVVPPSPAHAQFPCRGISRFRCTTVAFFSRGPPACL
ncbi:MAG TPA: hypothetical protein VFB20_04795 [Burkholderiales bacterium]|nr:hypothetical protein [Burkholderiales bacterium]